MEKPGSKLASGRRNGKHQIDWQRARILDIAQKLFLQNGLKAVRMGDIAAEAGITKITLYRYFANIDEIAVQIHERMLSQIVAQLAPEELTPSLESLKMLVQKMIRNFAALRDVYRYMGMFDSLYLDNPPGTSITEWTKQQLVDFLFGGAMSENFPRELKDSSRYAVILNTTTWFLEKLALRSELTWSDPTIPLETHLKTFEEMIMLSIDAQPQ